MPIVVRVLSTADYTEWVQAKQKEMLALADDPTKIYTLAELKERGAKVYASNCAVCHQPSGKGGGIYPALDGSKVVLGSEPEQIKLLLQGRKAMPSWKSLSDVELAAVMTFTRNNWSNQTGELIQPAMFTAARANK
jgi:cytochrome c oxidase subunit 2